MILWCEVHFCISWNAQSIRTHTGCQSFFILL